MGNKKQRPRESTDPVAPAGRAAGSSRRRQPANAGPRQPLAAAVATFLVGALLIGRLLVPTEGSVQGETLWMVQLWLAAGAMWAWGALRAGEFRLRWDRLDWWLWVIVAGHVLSAIAVWRIGGDKRLAVNMLWEWIGLGIAFFLWRQVASSRFDRMQIATVMVTATAAIAALGIYQHYVWYQRTAAEYRAMRSELDRAVKSPRPTDANQAFARQARIRELEARFAAQGIPLEGTSRMLWENRLVASSEPFGLFALANTLSGLLVAWGTVAAGVLARRLRSGQRLVGWIGPGLAVAVIGFCLLLTKSRTAWAGLIAAAFVWATLACLPGRIELRRHWVLGLLGAAAFVAAAVGIAAVSGGLDRAVLTEATKSLQYRAQYWTGAAKVVREHPVLGTGPGNFRQHYLRFKAPESSEEIAEPHNFVLDVWTSGGVIGIVGLIGFLATALRGRLRRILPPIANETPPRGVNRVRSPLTAGALSGFAVVFGFFWLVDGVADWRLAVLAAAFGALLVAVWKGAGAAGDHVSSACFSGAAFGLLVHLLGSGGIEMPAIAQSLLLLVGMASANDESTIPAPGKPHLALGLLLVMSVLFTACLASATIPVLYRAALLRIGDSAAIGGDAAAAERSYREAAQRDPFSPEPAERLAETAFRRWQGTTTGQNEFDRAVEFQRLAIELNPHNPFAYRKLGTFWLAKFERSREEQDALKAAEWFTAAGSRYPHNAALRAELASSWEGAGRKDAAAAEAARSLELDAINRAQGHRDKYLAPASLESLRKIAANSTGNDSAERPPN